MGLAQSLFGWGMILGAVIIDASVHRIDWSDSWSDEDLKEFRAASLRRLEAEESEDKD